MDQRIEEETKRQIAGFLPRAIAGALSSYHSFMCGHDVPDDAKGFSAHHSACKVAIAHIELLIKLARWADLPDPDKLDADEAARLENMMRDAEAELARYHAGAPEEDETA